MVKAQFAVPAGLVMVNAANLCPSPYAVTGAQDNYSRGLEQDVSFQYRARFEDLRKKALVMLADFLGAGAGEVGVTRNTSESNNIIVNGLDLGPGDEVVIWDQNHPSNAAAWEQRARRHGFRVVKVSLPAAPQTEAELIRPFADALQERTRLLAFSHISNTSGMALPAGDICRLARQRGVLTLVDGAQSFGMAALDLKAMGCDFYTGSAHKWLMGPKETGILYVRKEQLHKVWPSVISAGWKEEGQTVDEKLCVLGQRDDPAIAALVEAMAFHNQIGRKMIESRVRQLVTYLKDKILKQLPQVECVTPLAAGLHGGVLVLSIPGKEPRAVFQQLYQTYGIAAAPTGGIRFSPHIYNTLEDMDRIVAALSALM